MRPSRLARIGVAFDSEAFCGPIDGKTNSKQSPWPREVIRQAPRVWKGVLCAHYPSPMPVRANSAPAPLRWGFFVSGHQPNDGPGKRLRLVHPPPIYTNLLFANDIARCAKSSHTHVYYLTKPFSGPAGLHLTGRFASRSVQARA